MTQHNEPDNLDAVVNQQQDIIRREHRALSANTMVNLGLVVVLIGIAVQGTRWAHGVETRQVESATEARHHRELLELKIDQIRSDILTRTADRWSKPDMVKYTASASIWVEQVEAALRAAGLDVDLPSFAPAPLNED